MPNEVRDCWSCEGAGKDAADVCNAIRDNRRGKDAKQLFLCSHCWGDRHCCEHDEPMSVFLGDMPAALRDASLPTHKPTTAAVSAAAKTCTVCHQHCCVTVA